MNRLSISLLRFSVILNFLFSICAQAQFQWPFPNPNQQGNVIGSFPLVLCKGRWAGHQQT